MAFDLSVQIRNYSEVDLTVFMSDNQNCDAETHLVLTMVTIRTYRKFVITLNINMRLYDEDLPTDVTIE